MKKILVLCTGNSCRSQMAEGLINHYFKDKYQAFSAGTKPGIVNPYSIKSMAELGIDISKNTSKHIDVFKNETFDIVITVCGNAKESCPAYFGEAIKHHWPFYDAAEAKGTEEEILKVFRDVRNKILEKFKKEL